MFIIEKIQGNSKIGVPVFSRIGKKSNFKFQVFQEGYQEKKDKLLKNRRETQLQTFFREYKDVGDQLQQEKNRIENRLVQIEIELQKQKNVPKRKDKPDDNLSPSAGGLDGDKSKNRRKRRQTQNAVQPQQDENQTESQSQAMKKLKSRPVSNSCQFKSISRDHYYIVHQNMFRDDAPPPIGHYNPKFTSIQKYDKSNYVILEERRENEIAAKDLKQKQFIEKFQVCDKFRRYVRGGSGNFKHRRDIRSQSLMPASDSKAQILSSSTGSARDDVQIKIIEHRLSDASNDERSSPMSKRKSSKNDQSPKLKSPTHEMQIQRSIGASTSLNSYQANQPRSQPGQRIGSAATHKSYLGDFYGFNGNNADSGHVIITDVENNTTTTFRPIDGFSSHIKGIQEEFSFHDVSYRNSKTGINNNQTESSKHQSEYQLTMHQNFTQAADMEQKQLINRSNIFRNQPINPYKTFNLTNSDKKQSNASRLLKGPDMSKNLPREFENFNQQSRKRPSQKLSEGPRNLIYDPSFKIVDERKDKHMRNFEKVISRDQQQKSIYDAIKPVTTIIQTHELNDISKCYDQLAHVKKDKAPDLKKFKDRDLDYIIKGSEAYNNIQRDNERYEYRNMFKLKRSRASRSSSISKQSKSISQKKE